MKKVLIIPFVLMFALFGFILTPAARGQQASACTAPEEAQTAVPLSQNLDIIPASTTVETATSGGPSTLIERPIYTSNGEQIFLLREIGLLVTEDGRPIMNPVDSTTAALRKDENGNYTQEFIDGANRKLSIYLNSFLDKCYLRSGSTGLEGINTSREVFLINLRKDGNESLIYAFREKVDHGISIIFKPGKWFNTEYRYFDMRNVQIENEYIISFDAATYAKAAIATTIFLWVTRGIGLLAAIFGGGAREAFDCPYVKVIDHTTLGGLLEEISHATIHPYDTIPNVTTEDGSAVWIRPGTKQCVDFFNYPLFDLNSGLPLVYLEGKVFTSNLLEVEIREGVLRDVVSTHQLLLAESEFYIGQINTILGTMDAVIFLYGDIKKDPDWHLPNGESAKGVINDLQFSAVLDHDGESLGSLLSRIANGIFGDGATNVFTDIFSAILIVIIVVIIVLLAPLVIGLFNKQAGTNKTTTRRKKK